MGTAAGRNGDTSFCSPQFSLPATHPAAPYTVPSFGGHWIGKGVQTPLPWCPLDPLVPLGPWHPNLRDTGYSTATPSSEAKAQWLALCSYRTEPISTSGSHTPQPPSCLHSRHPQEPSCKSIKAHSVHTDQVCSYPQN